MATTRQQQHGNGNKLVESTSETTTPQVIYVPLERGREIRHFYGDEGPASLQTFIEDLQACWSSRPTLTKEAKVDQLMSYLGPRARAELKLCPKEKRQDPDEIFSVLREQFGETRSLSELLRQYAETSQLASETIVDFSHRLWSAWEAVRRCQKRENRQQLDDKTLRDHLVDAVYDVGLKRYLISEVERAPDSTFKDMRDKAKRWDRVDVPRTSTATAAAAVVPGAAEAGLTSKIDELIRQMTIDREALIAELKASREQSQTSKPPRRDPSQPVICYACRKQGHIARFCPQQQSSLRNQGNESAQP